MQNSVATVEQYINELPDGRKNPVMKLREIILSNLPEGFAEEMSYGMIGYVIPHSIYPKGYHCNEKLPLPFINLASQKNFIAFYHMGLYASEKLKNWFFDEYDKLGIGKPDAGKSCIRFKNPEKIPYQLIGELVTKMSCNDWIAMYESSFVKVRG